MNSELKTGQNPNHIHDFLEDYMIMYMEIKYKLMRKCPLNYEIWRKLESFFFVLVSQRLNELVGVI